MVKRLVWSVTSQQQKKRVFEYWNERNKSKTYSRKLNSLFNEAAEMLPYFPNLGQKTDFKNVRIKVVRDYWMAYQVKKDEISILTLWDTRQNPDKFENILKTLIE